MNAPELLSRLDAATSNTVYMAKINWLNFNPLGMFCPDRPRPRVEIKAMRYSKYIGATPLRCAGGACTASSPAMRLKMRPHRLR